VNTERCARCATRNIACEYNRDNFVHFTPPVTATIHHREDVAATHYREGAPGSPHCRRRTFGVGSRLMEFSRLETIASESLISFASSDSYASSSCENPDERGCHVPQIPVGQLLQAMITLNGEIANMVSSLFGIPICDC